MRNKMIKSVFGVMVAMFFVSSGYAQTGSKASKFELFRDTFPQEAQWTGSEKTVRKGGYTQNSTHYIYLKPSDSPAGLSGLSIPIREHPKAGEYRYITFTWVKWGGGQVGVKFAYDASARISSQGKKYDYTYYSGEGDNIVQGFKLDDKAPGHWMVTTRDLWKDFGDFTLTGISFLCPTRRDAGFDAIVLGNDPNAFEGVPGILPTKVGVSVVLEDDSISLDESAFAETDEATGDMQQVQIDWAAQIKAGGFMMYPLYLLGVLALVIALQRMMTSREGRLAPKKLRREVNESLLKNDMKSALAACDKYPSTLASSLRFILDHRKAGKDAVSQTAGDMAARDIRTHLSRISPLSVIASVAPLLGLLGTIVGMIEAFGLVALYGDEGGAAILSDSISKALITTAAGLIIAAPSVYLYFVIKNRVMRLASVIEVEIEKMITCLYLKEEGDNHAPEI
jgi:biopolymer transport protein ExbB